MIQTIAAPTVKLEGAALVYSSPLLLAKRWKSVLI
jgi:hypothetical protein